MRSPLKRPPAGPRPSALEHDAVLQAAAFEVAGCNGTVAARLVAEHQADPEQSPLRAALKARLAAGGYAGQRGAVPT